MQSRMTHGTFRNKISKLIKNGMVELSYHSSCAFYTLSGYKFGKPMTPNPVVVHNNPVYQMLEDIPFDKKSIHDIHLKFNVPDIWQICSLNRDFFRIKRSHDIVIPTWNNDNMMVRIVVHKTNVVSVIVGCSLSPIPLDANGIIDFFNLLVRVEEKLKSIFDSSSITKCGKERNTIPGYKKWIVTMWHFGRDASIEYTGQRYCITIQNLQHILTRIYVKDFNGKNRIRIEKQEYPKKTVIDAIEEKLNVSNCQ
jgi:hypothetical protein